MTKLVFKSREARPSSLLNRLLQKELAALCLCTSTLIAIVAGATYAGSSPLLGAYIAGAMISWWDAEASQLKLASSSIPPTGGSGGSQTEGVEISSTHDGPETQGDEGEARINSHSGSELFEKYYEPVLHRVFKPLFFVCLGPSLTFLQLLTRE
jgi:Kef-type K+ transport system membrane component KefB